MFVTNAETGAILDANRAAERFYGYSLQVLQTKNISDIRLELTPDAQAAPNPLESQSADADIRPHRLGSGQIRLMEEFSTPFAMGEGTYLFSVFLDVTERRELELKHLHNEETARQKIEDALRLSEDKFAKAFKISPDAININRFTDGMYLEINDGFTAMTGYTREDVAGRSSLPGDLGIWVNREDRLRMLTQLQAQGEVIGLEAPFRRKDGTILVGSMSARVVEINGERCILTVTRDLTQRLKQEAALRERERNYREIFNATSDGLVILNEQGVVTDINEQLCAMFGVTCPDMLGLSIYTFIKAPAPFSAAEAAEHVHRALTAGLQAFSWQFRLRAGGDRWVEVVLKAGEINDQKRIIASIRDITERKKAVDSLATERERLLVTLRSIGDGVIATDTQGKVVVMNKVAEQLTGWQQAEAQGRPLAEVFSIVQENTKEPFENPVDKVLISKNIVELANHTLLISRDGQEYVIGDSGAPIFDKQGEIIGVVLVFRDMTEKQRLIEAAQRTQKLESLSVLAGGIAHDFNNLLGGIFGCLDLAKTSSRDSKVSEYLDSALGAMDRARALTHQLLTFAKGGAPVRKVLPLAPFLKETANFALSGSNVTYNLEIAPELWAVEFDKNQLGQVVDNLLINAQQAMPSGGRVHITAENVQLHKREHAALPPGDYVRITFADRGAGIPREILPRIFDPFFTTKQKGSGLGLATCYSIMSQHHGSIDVKSEPGEGSAFYLYLPARQGAVLVSAETAPKTKKRTGRILFMDDEEVIRNIVCEMLGRLGYTCVGTANGVEAVQRFQQAQQEGQPFSAAILDLTVPGGMGGKEAASLIRGWQPSLPLIVSSGYAEDPVVASPREYGFSASLRKPFVMSELAKILDELLP
jgi:PAS domain S-box-containing protein